MTIAEMKNEAEMSQLIDIVNEIRVSEKYLIIYIDTLNTVLLQNKTINFNVMINHRDTGVTINVFCAYMLWLFVLINLFI